MPEQARPEAADEIEDLYLIAARVMVVEAIAAGPFVLNIEPNGGELLRELRPDILGERRAPPAQPGLRRSTDATSSPTVRFAWSSGSSSAISMAIVLSTARSRSMMRIESRP